MSERPEDLVKKWREKSLKLNMKPSSYPEANAANQAEEYLLESCADELEAALARRPKAEPVAFRFKWVTSGEWSGWLDLSYFPSDFADDCERQYAFAGKMSADFLAETLGAILDKYAPRVSDIMCENGGVTLRDKIILEAVPALAGGEK